jgi:type IV pilus assembly protein PilW
MAGVSLIELMISLVLGLMVLAALVTVFANTSASRNELERSSRQIENGRFAMEILSDELRLAGFYGELDLKTMTATVLPNPCSLVIGDWRDAMPIHVYGYDNGASVPGCIPADLKANTDVLVVRRTSSCEAGVGGCAAAVAGQPYLQVSKCATEQVITPFVLGLSGTAAFTLKMKDCTTVAGLRRYLVDIYYVSNDNGSGQPVPTLKMMSFDGAAFTVTPLVEGIEWLNIEYGIDNDGDGAPDVYTTAPVTVADWASVMTARINLLARNIETSPNYTDSKTYSLGLDAGGAVITVAPGDAYRRHVYTGLVRVVNAAERRN